MSKIMSFETERLFLSLLCMEDEVFILELLNTEGWIKFIGDRDIHSLHDARAYIQKVNNNPDIRYWVAERKTDKAKIGLITLVKRNFLPDPDIGFAFLPAYAGYGYAHEAAAAFLKIARRELCLQKLTAISIPENTNSVKLLEKLGFTLEKEIEEGGERLLQYAVVI